MDLQCTRFPDEWKFWRRGGSVHAIGMDIKAILMYALLYPTFVGPMAAAHALKRKVKAGREYHRWRKQWPKPMSKSRRPMQTSTAQSSNAGLFSRLPYELRLQIYGYLLGGAQARLTLPYSPMCLSEEFGYFQRYRDSGHYRGQSHRFEDQYSLANLLMTCRLVYMEASHVLYASNTFTIVGLQNVPSFVGFSRMASKTSLAYIRSLHVKIQAWQEITYHHKRLSRRYRQGSSDDRLRYPYASRLDPDRNYPWRQLWAVIVDNLHGLKTLTVVLQEQWPYWVHRHGCVVNRGQLSYIELSLVPEIEEEWVRPMLRVRGLRNFHLELLSESADSRYRERLFTLEKKARRVMCSAREEEV